METSPKELVRVRRLTVSSLASPWELEWVLEQTSTHSSHSYPRNRYRCRSWLGYGRNRYMCRNQRSFSCPGNRDRDGLTPSHPGSRNRHRRRLRGNLRMNLSGAGGDKWTVLERTECGAKAVSEVFA